MLCLDVVDDVELVGGGFLAAGADPAQGRVPVHILGDQGVQV